MKWHPFRRPLKLPTDLVERYRLSVARQDAVLQLALLGVVAGILAGVTIILFRLLVQAVQHQLTGGPFGDFAGLSPEGRLLLPLAGGLAMGLVFQWLTEGDRSVGILHILHRLAYHQGHLPWRNALAQFFGGVVAIASGHSVGREGPSAHLGAASSNLPAQGLGLPNNSLRITAACGTAAGIAASFNTPLAGVAFAMEVLLLNYTITGLAPVILASVSATMLSRWAFGDELAFTVPPVRLDSLLELPFIMLGGIVIGLVAAGFVQLVRRLMAHSARLPVWLVFTLAGGVAGLCGMVVPEVMGIGDQTITDTLSGDFGFRLLLLILLFKFVATVVCVGVGIPGGTIGPALVIGAVAGALLALCGRWLGLGGDGAVALYALTGMAAMMAAILQAPLAGLIAVLELTGNPNMILPGMLAVVAATLTAGRFTGGASIFQNLLRQLGLDYRNDPLVQSRRRLGVAAAMERGLAVLPRQVTRQQVDADLDPNTRWILVRDEGKPDTLLAAIDLVNAMDHAREQDSFDLLAVPGKRLQASAVDLQGSLQDAHERLQESGAEALYITRQIAPGIYRYYGVLTPESLELAWHY